MSCVPLYILEQEKQERLARQATFDLPAGKEIIIDPERVEFLKHQEWLRSFEPISFPSNKKSKNDFSISEGRLSIGIMYSGVPSCPPLYDLIWDGQFHKDERQRPCVYVAITRAEDNRICAMGPYAENLSVKRTFDISPFKDAGTNRLIIHFIGSNEFITYNPLLE